MSAHCPQNPEICDRNYCQREKQCAERAASAPFAALTQPSAVVQEPVYHLRQYGDVTEAEMTQYMATGAIGKAEPTAQPERKELFDKLEHLYGKLESNFNNNRDIEPVKAEILALLYATPEAKVEPTPPPGAGDVKKFLKSLKAKPHD